MKLMSQNCCNFMRRTACEDSGKLTLKLLIFVGVGTAPLTAKHYLSVEKGQQTYFLYNEFIVQFLFRKQDFWMDTTVN